MYKFVYNFLSYLTYQSTDYAIKCVQMLSGIYFYTSFSPEVPRCRTEATLDTGHTLHLTMRYIVVELGIRGARSIVANAGKLTYADVFVCLEVLVECIGQLGYSERFAYLALDLELHIGKAVEQVFVGAEADTDTPVHQASLLVPATLWRRLRWQRTTGV